jgi:enolase
MPSSRVLSVEAAEILDSRGYPTLEVTLVVEAGTVRASVPSGKSTGVHEATERRDGDRHRYGGKGVLQAGGAVNGEIAAKLVGSTLPSQRELDAALVALDGTPTRSRLGANTLLGVSIAAARAHALLRSRPLHESLALDLRSGRAEDAAYTLPVPCFNVLNGGAHANNGLAFQEFMLVPGGFATYADALRAGAEVYHALAAHLAGAGISTAVGDEGGFAPPVETAERAMLWLVDAITRAGYTPGAQVGIALDPAASAFYVDGYYRIAGTPLSTDDMCTMYEQWLRYFPIVSIEDGLAETDHAGWARLTRDLGDSVQIVGDDLFVSNATRVADGIRRGLANAVLLKPNQVGTVSELADALDTAGRGGFRAMMSHRSGETDDPFIADLAVALDVRQIKAGAPARGERVAKYNQLLRIERTLGDRGSFAGWDAFAHGRASTNATDRARAVRTGAAGVAGI